MIFFRHKSTEKSLHNDASAILFRSSHAGAQTCHSGTILQLFLIIAAFLDKLSIHGKCVCFGFHCRALNVFIKRNVFVTQIKFESFSARHTKQLDDAIQINGVVCHHISVMLMRNLLNVNRHGRSPLQ